MSRRAPAALLAARTGVSAVETALVLTLFLGLLFGIINFSLMAWTKASLLYAVETAARCASVNATTCSSPAATESYAMSQYFGQTLAGGNPFTYSANGCGHTVSANYTYAMSIPFFGRYAVPLSATACFP